MAEKRIEINDATLERLKRLSEAYANAPRSRERLSEAIEAASERAERCENERVLLSKADREYLEDLIHFGIYTSKETAVREAIKLLKAKKSDEVEALLKKRLGIGEDQ